MKLERTIHLSALLPVLALAACGVTQAPAPTDDFGHDGTGIKVNMGALTYPGAVDVCYSFTVVNGLDQLVVGRGLASTITDTARNPAYATWGANTPYVENAPYANGLPLVCSTQFGNGAGGDWSYVAPCDASTDAATHTVTVWLDQFLAGDPPAPLTEGPDYQDPCTAGCSVQVACAENADTPVSFNFTIMRAANQGFFDVGVNFDDVFCSAKLDTCHVDADDNVTPIGLLFDPATGARNHTAVAAVACSVGAGADLDTTLWMTDFVVTCPDTDGTAGGTYTLDLSTVTAEGNLTLTDGGGSGNTLPAGVYFGDEALPDVNKVYANVAFLLPDTGEPCFVKWTVVPTEGDAPPDPAAAGPGTYTNIAAVIFDAPEGSDDPGAEVQYAYCHAHKLNAGASRTTTPFSALSFFGTPIPSGVYTTNGDAPVPATSCLQASQSETLFEAGSCGVLNFISVDATALTIRDLEVPSGHPWDNDSVFEASGTTDLAAGTSLTIQVLSNFAIDEAGTRLTIADGVVAVMAGAEGVNTWSFETETFTVSTPTGWAPGPSFIFGPDDYDVRVTGGGATGTGIVRPSPFLAMNFKDWGEDWEANGAVGRYTVALDGITVQPVGTPVTWSGGASIGLPAGLATTVGENTGNAPPGYYSFTPVEVALDSLPPAGSYEVLASVGELERSALSQVNEGVTIDQVNLSFPYNDPQLWTFSLDLQSPENLDLSVSITCISGACVGQVPEGPLDWHYIYWWDWIGDYDTGYSISWSPDWYPWPDQTEWVDGTYEISVRSTYDGGPNRDCLEDGYCNYWVALPVTSTFTVVSPGNASNFAPGDLDPDAPEGFSFAYVPTGVFQRGSPLDETGRVDGGKEEQHWVSVTRAIWMQTTEVTQGQWKALSGDVNPSTHTACGDSCPVERVNWYSALGYANALSVAEGLTPCYTVTMTGCTGTGQPGNWQSGLMSCSGTGSSISVAFEGLDCTGYRLPTEAEWEHAARAGTTRATYRGDLTGTTGCVALTGTSEFEGEPLSNIAHHNCPSPVNITTTVASKHPNPWGLYDVLGNVWELTWDEYQVYSTTIEEAMPPISFESPLADPLGPSGPGTSRVARGGCYDCGPASIRAAERQTVFHTGRFPRIGFRLVKTVTP